MKITSKGQVTIPEEIRRKAGLLPHTEVEFAIEEGRVTVRKAATRKSGDRGARMLRKLRGSATVSMTTDQILALTRGR
jgi:AbrB family looped-hinge helix DNA binding protein